MGKNVYFDHAAASAPTAEILQIFQRESLRCFANAEAVHGLAYQAKTALKRAGEELSMLLFDRKDHPVIWGGSATELFRVLASFPEFTASAATALDHPALLANLRNFTAPSILPVMRDGSIRIADVPPVSLGCIHQVQSELGMMPDTAGFFQTLPGACRMVDAVQAAGKMPLAKSADVWVISGVKFGAPGGAAMVLAADGKFTDKLLAHAENCRKTEYAVGRVSVPLALTMTAALAQAAEKMTENYRRISEINAFIRQECAAMGIVPTLPENVPVSPYILNLLLPEQESAVVIRALSALGIYAAAGSACSAESSTPSPALTALGIPAKKAYRALRLSFGPENNAEDAEIFLSGLKTVLKNY